MWKLFNMLKVNVAIGTLKIDFPALADLVSFLRERDKTQEHIDALSVQVAGLTERLKKSEAGLEAAVPDK